MNTARLARMREAAAIRIEDGRFALPGGWMDSCGSLVCVGSARTEELVDAVLDAAGVPSLLDSVRELHRRHASVPSPCLGCDRDWPCPTARLVYTDDELAVL